MLFTRIGLNILMVSSILFLPWWFSVLLALVLLFGFEAVEVLGWGLLIDILYGTPLTFFYNFTFIFTLLFFILFLTTTYLKKYLVFYQIP